MTIEQFPNLPKNKNGETIRQAAARVLKTHGRARALAYCERMYTESPSTQTVSFWFKAARIVREMATN